MSGNCIRGLLLPVRADGKMPRFLTTVANRSRTHLAALLGCFCQPEVMLLSRIQKATADPSASRQDDSALWGSNCSPCCLCRSNAGAEDSVEKCMLLASDNGAYHSARRKLSRFRSCEYDDGLRVSISADNNVQFAGANINASSIWMKDWQCVTSSLALLGHLLLRSCRSDARGADTDQTPNRDRRRKPANVITRLYATPDPRFSVGLQIEHQCRRGL